MTVSFNEVPTGLLVPFVSAEFDNSLADQGPGVYQYRVLMIGQRLTTGTQAAGEAVRITSASQAQAAFGTGSMLADQFNSWFKNNTTTEIWAVAFDDNAAGVQATGSVTFGGTVSAGTIAFYIGGKRITVGVSASDTADDIATAFAATVNSNTDLNVSAAVDGVDTAKVNLTARHKGECGNDIDLRYSYYNGEALPTGLTVSITAMAGGTGNPDISSLWPLLGDKQYHFIISPYTDGANITSLTTELDDRASALRMIEGIAVAAKSGTQGDLGTFGDSLNNEYLSVIGNNSIVPTWVVSAAVTAKVAYHGQIDPARPFQTLEVVGILPKPEAEQWTLQERNLLLQDSIATLAVTAGGGMMIERMVTTYQTNNSGAADKSYQDVNSILTLGYLRWDLRTRWMKRFPRHKLASDGFKPRPGQAVVTPKLAKAEVATAAESWANLGLIESPQTFMDGVIVERDAQDVNRLNMRLQPDLMNQLRFTGIQIQFKL